MVYVQRTYQAVEGKMPELIDRFKNHTVRLFLKHDIKPVGFFLSQLPEGSNLNKLVYILEFTSPEHHKTAWNNFREDKEWQAVKAETEKNGPLISNVECVYLNPVEDILPALKPQL